MHFGIVLMLAAYWLPTLLRSLLAMAGMTPMTMAMGRPLFTSVDVSVDSAGNIYYSHASTDPAEELTDLVIKIDAATGQIATRQPRSP